MVKTPPVRADPIAHPPSTASAWNIANGLTVFRLLLVPVFIAALFHNGGHATDWRIWAWAVFAVASITDRFDGELARKRNLVTEFGKLADPIADKALVGAALVGLSLLHDLSWWVTVVILVREVGVTILRFWVIRHGVIAASRGGKIKTLLQGVAIGLFVLPLSGWLHAVAWVFMIAAIVIALATGVDYIARALRLRRTGRAARVTACVRPGAALGIGPEPGSLRSLRADVSCLAARRPVSPGTVTETDALSLNEPYPDRGSTRCQCFAKWWVTPSAACACASAAPCVRSPRAPGSASVTCPRSSAARRSPRRNCSPPSAEPSTSSCPSCSGRSAPPCAARRGSFPVAGWARCPARDRLASASLPVATRSAPRSARCRPWPPDPPQPSHLPQPGDQAARHPRTTAPAG